MEFKNRVKELTLLDNLYNSKKPKLIIMYGRRRVGKTALLRKFISKHLGIYILARQESELEQLKKISSQIAEFYKDEVLEKNLFHNWDAVFLYLAKKPRIPIIIDEFPYLAQSSKSILGILQDFWDNYFSNNNSFIILCGSSINMMEELLGKKSPIYGRRTEQILLEPLKFRDSCLFFPKEMPTKGKIINYAVLGGMPAYILEFDFSQNIEKNILENILQKNKFLYQDVLFSLKEELKEPRNYFSILYSIAKGNSKLGNIVNDTGLEKSFVAKYLAVLIDLQIIERKVPITEKNQKSSRKGVYSMKDHFFRFWFRYVFENEEYIEQEKQEKLMKEKIMPELNAFVGKSFEDIVRDTMIDSKDYSGYIFGRWWDNNSEADIVGIDKQNKKILIGEIKFRNLDKKDIIEIQKSLAEKAKKININGFEEQLVVICLDFKEKSDNIKIIRFEEILNS